MDELRKLLLHEIIGIYGPTVGQGIGSVIIPAFIGDFKKVLEESKDNKTVSEEYMTEDKKVHLLLKGKRALGATGMDYLVTYCHLNGRDILAEGVEGNVTI
ncbi:MAG: hypothetical protein IKO84_05260 [Butyrivibrio sp.]|nr:hypothetical protein [Butyrivibrio sp.]